MFHRAAGRDIITFGATRKHINLFPGTKALSAIKQHYTELDCTKAAIRLPHDKPLPYELLREVCGIIQQELRNH